MVGEGIPIKDRSRGTAEVIAGERRLIEWSSLPPSGLRLLCRPAGCHPVPNRDFSFERIASGLVPTAACRSLLENRLPGLEVGANAGSFKMHLDQEMTGQYVLVGLQGRQSGCGPT